MMTATKLNKLKNLLSTMEEENNNTERTNGSNGGSKKKDYLPFFSPNKMFVGRDEVVVRILPNKDDFYFQYKKHMVSMGVGNFKQIVCMNSEDENGIALDTKCPLCDFLKEHGSEIDKQIAWQLSAKDVFIMFVFNPYAKQIQRYEVQQKAMIDITRAVVNLIDESGNNFDPNAEGFDIVFVMDGKYPKCVKAIVPKMSVVDTLAEATNGDVVLENHDIKSFMSEIMPYAKSTTERYVNSTVQTIIAGMCPEFNVNEYLFEDKSTEFNTKQFNSFKDPFMGNGGCGVAYISGKPTNDGYTEDDVPPVVRNRRGTVVEDNYSYTDEIGSVDDMPPEEETSNSTVNNDEPITDIRSFLSKRNKQ